MQRFPWGQRDTNLPPSQERTKKCHWEAQEQFQVCWRPSWATCGQVAAAVPPLPSSLCWQSSFKCNLNSFQLIQKGSSIPRLSPLEISSRNELCWWETFSVERVSAQHFLPCTRSLFLPHAWGGNPWGGCNLPGSQKSWSEGEWSHLEGWDTGDDPNYPLTLHQERRAVMLQSKETAFPPFPHNLTKPQGKSCSSPARGNWEPEEEEISVNGGERNPKLSKRRGTAGRERGKGFCPLEKVRNTKGSSLQGQLPPKAMLLLSFCSRGWERQNSTAEQQPHIRGAGEWNQDWDMAHKEPKINREQPKPKTEPNKGAGLSLCGTSPEGANPNPIKAQTLKAFSPKKAILFKPKFPKLF